MERDLWGPLIPSKGPLPFSQPLFGQRNRPALLKSSDWSPCSAEPGFAPLEAICAPPLSSVVALPSVLRAIIAQSGMRNIKLTIAYDGAAFHGWQVQPGLATVQGALNEAARQRPCARAGGALQDALRASGR